VNENVYHWGITFTNGKDKTCTNPIAMIIHFTDDFPAHPPQVRFISKISHKNVDHDGKATLEILSKDNWTEDIGVDVLLMTIYNSIIL